MDREFKDYLETARSKYLRLEFATAESIKNIFARVANKIRDYLYSLPPESLQRKYYNELLAYIERNIQELNDEIIKQIAQGRKLAISVFTEHAKDNFEKISYGIWNATDIESMFTAINERAIIALATRTRAYGLKVSDRVWRISQDARRQLTQAIEDGIASGRDPRKVARDIQALLNPGVRTELRKETRKKFTAPKDVCMEAMRLAVTEMQHAAHEATIMSYYHMPTCEGFIWKLSNNHPVTDICDEYANKFFDKDMVPSKPHPWCRCYLVPKMKPPEYVREELRAWIANPLSKPDYEKWYQSVKDILPRPSPALLQKITPKQITEIKERIIGVKKWRRAKTHEEAMNIAKELDLINSVFYDRETIDLRLANDMNKALFNIVSEFPQLKNSLYFSRADGTMMKAYFNFLRERYPHDYVRRDEALQQKLYWEEFMRVWENIKNYLSTYRYLGVYYPDDGLITIYYTFGKSGSYRVFKTKVELSVIRGESPQNCNKPIYIAYHEIGHAIHYALNFIVSEDIRDEFIREKWEYFKNLTEEEQKNVLCLYAARNPDEMIAEAWASYCMEKYERSGQASSFAKEIGEYIERKLKEMR